MNSDPIIEEIRKRRQAHAAKHGNDLDKICAALRQRQAESKRPVVERKPRLRLPNTRS